MTTAMPEAFDLKSYKHAPFSAVLGYDDDLSAAQKQMEAACKRVEIPQLEETADGDFVWTLGHVEGNFQLNSVGELEFTAYRAGAKVRCRDADRKLLHTYWRLKTDMHFGFNDTSTIYGVMATDSKGRFLDTYALHPWASCRDGERHIVYSPRTILAEVLRD